MPTTKKIKNNKVEESKSIGYVPRDIRGVSVSDTDTFVRAL